MAKKNTWTKERLAWMDRVCADRTLSLAAKSAAYVVSGFTNKDSRRTDPSQKAIAQRLGCSPRTVYDLVNELCERRYLVKRKRYGRSIVYSINYPSHSSEDVCKTDSSEDVCETEVDASFAGSSNTGKSDGSDTPVPKTSATQFRRRVRTNPNREPFKGIGKGGAALQAPASDPFPSESRSTTPLTPHPGEAALRAAEAASCDPDTVEAKISELIELAEKVADENPDLTSAERALRYLHGRHPAAFYEEQAALLRQLALSCCDVGMKDRAQLAYVTLLEQADLMDYAAEIARPLGFVSTRTMRDLDDEVPF